MLMRLYIGSAGFVAAFDVKDGHELWRTPLGVVPISDVCVLEHEGRVFAGNLGSLYALDAETGKILWKNDLKGMGYDDVTLSVAGKAIQFVSSKS